MGSFKKQERGFVCGFAFGYKSMPKSATEKQLESFLKTSTFLIASLLQILIYFKSYSQAVE